MEKKEEGDSDEFQINFWNMKQATEMIIADALRIWVRTSIMGSKEKLSSTRALEDLMVPYEDIKFRQRAIDLRNILDVKKRQCIGRDNIMDNEKMEQAQDDYANEMFVNIWCLLSRHGMIPQKSEVSWSR